RPTHRAEQVEVVDIDIIAADARTEVPPQGALCHDCRIDTAPLRPDGRPDFKRWDYYIVRDEVWAEAGMDGWDSGYLCMSCLMRRLKRDLVTGKDLLCWPLSATNRALRMRATVEYTERVLRGRGH